MEEINITVDTEVLDDWIRSYCINCFVGEKSSIL